MAEALAGAAVVVDVSNSPSFEDGPALAFFESSGRTLAREERQAGVRHHVALSVVGTDRLQDSGYFRAKLAQERLIEGSGIPYTIVRATQFFEFLGAIAASGATDDGVHLSNASFQPMAAEDVATAVAAAALAEPANGTIEIAGPERQPAERAGRALPHEHPGSAEGRDRSERSLLRRAPRRSLAGSRREPAARENPTRRLAAPVGGALTRHGAQASAARVGRVHRANNAGHLGGMHHPDRAALVIGTGSERAMTCDERGHTVRSRWQEFGFGWGELDEAGPQTENSIERGFRRAGPVDDEFGRSECIDPDNVGDIADEGTGHRG